MGLRPFFDACVNVFLVYAIEQNINVTGRINLASVKEHVTKNTNIKYDRQNI